MLITTGEAKRFIFDLVYLTGERDLKGVVISRASFKNEHWQAAISFREKLLSQVEVEVIRDGAPVWVSPSDVKQGEAPMRERFNLAPLELEGSELALVEYYVKQAKEKPLVSSACAKELSGLI